MADIEFTAAVVDEISGFLKQLPANFNSTFKQIKSLNLELVPGSLEDLSQNMQDAVQDSEASLSELKRDLLQLKQVAEKTKIDFVSGKGEASLQFLKAVEGQISQIDDAINSIEGSSTPLARFSEQLKVLTKQNSNVSEMADNTKELGRSAQELQRALVSGGVSGSVDQIATLNKVIDTTDKKLKDATGKSIKFASELRGIGQSGAGSVREFARTLEQALDNLREVQSGEVLSGRGFSKQFKDAGVAIGELEQQIKALKNAPEGAVRELTQLTQGFKNLSGNSEDVQDSLRNIRAAIIKLQNTTDGFKGIEDVEAFSKAIKKVDSAIDSLGVSEASTGSMLVRANDLINDQTSDLSRLKSEIDSTRKQIKQLLDAQEDEAATTRLSKKEVSAFTRALKDLRIRSRQVATDIGRNARENRRAYERMFSKIKSGFDLGMDVGREFIQVVQSIARAYKEVAKFSAKVVQDIANTGGEFQRFRLQLTALTGSAIEANNELNKIRNFAASSPLETSDVVRSFLRLRSLAIGSAREVTKDLANLALIFGRKVEDVVASFVSMEVRTLRQLGINLTRGTTKAVIETGEKVLVVKNNIEELRGAVLDLLKARAGDNVQGILSKSYLAQLSVFRSLITEIKADISDIAFTSQFASMLVKVNKSLAEMRPTIRGLTKLLTQDLNKGFKVITDSLADTLQDPKIRAQLDSLQSDLTDVMLRLGQVTTEVFVGAFKVVGAAALKVVADIGVSMFRLAVQFQNMIDISGVSDINLEKIDDLTARITALNKERRITAIREDEAAKARLESIDKELEVLKRQRLLSTNSINPANDIAAKSMLGLQTLSETLSDTANDIMTNTVKNNIAPAMQGVAEAVQSGISGIQTAASIGNKVMSDLGSKAEVIQSRLQNSLEQAQIVGELGFSLNSDDAEEFLANTNQFKKLEDLKKKFTQDLLSSDSEGTTKALLEEFKRERLRLEQTARTVFGKPVSVESVIEANTKLSDSMVDKLKQSVNKYKEAAKREFGDATVQDALLQGGFGTQQLNEIFRVYPELFADLKKQVLEEGKGFVEFATSQSPFKEAFNVYVRDAENAKKFVTAAINSINIKFNTGSAALNKFNKETGKVSAVIKERMEELAKNEKNRAAILQAARTPSGLSNVVKNVLLTEEETLKRINKIIVDNNVTSAKFGKNLEFLFNRSELVDQLERFAISQSKVDGVIDQKKLFDNLTNSERLLKDFFDSAAFTAKNRAKIIQQSLKRSLELDPKKFGKFLQGFETSTIIGNLSNIKAEFKALGLVAEDTTQQVFDFFNTPVEFFEEQQGQATSALVDSVQAGSKILLRALDKTGDLASKKLNEVRDKLRTILRNGNGEISKAAREGLNASLDEGNFRLLAKQTADLLRQEFGEGVIDKKTLEAALKSLQGVVGEKALFEFINEDAEKLKIKRLQAQVQAEGAGSLKLDAGSAAVQAPAPQAPAPAPAQSVVIPQLSTGVGSSGGATQVTINVAFSVTVDALTGADAAGVIREQAGEVQNIIQNALENDVNFKDSVQRAAGTKR